MSGPASPASGPASDGGQPTRRSAFPPAQLGLPLAIAGDAATVGGKAASLGELARAGIPVPQGFVLTVSAFAAAMAAIDPSGGMRAQIEALPADDLPRIAQVTAAARDRVLSAPLPVDVAAAIEAGYAALSADSGTEADSARVDPDVAVRSSALGQDRDLH
jgi:phosphoenolpyruvate synthase/pyruvate phosphate dikinase